MSRRGVQKQLEPFRLPTDPDGNIVIPLDNQGQKHYGAVQRHYRIFVKGWSSQEFAIRYTEALRKMGVETDEEDRAEVTARWVRLMEQKNRIPVDEKRRWIIATLLGIPAASFGLVPAESLIQRQEITSLLFRPKKHINIAEYTSFLRSSWELNHINSVKQLREEIMCRITHLHNEVLYGNPGEYTQEMRLLCYYHQLNARSCCDLQRLPEAIDAMNKAYRIAKILKSSELQALVLFRRGFVYKESGYARIAVDDFDAALNFLPKISQPLQGAIQLAVAQGHSFLAQTEKDKTEFLRLLDDAHNNMGGGYVDESEHFMGFDEDSYIRDRAFTLTGSPVAKLRVVHEASELINTLKVTSNTPRLQAIVNRLEAKIYFDKGYYKMAAASAMEALNCITYTYNTVEVAMICQLLKESKHSNMKEVTDLELALLKAQQPQLFH